jgi:hypothetical protein
MRIASKEVSNRSLSTVLFITAALACYASAAVGVKEEIKFAVKINTYADGGYRVSTVRQVGRLDHSSDSDRLPGAGARPTALSWPPLLASLSWHGTRKP